MRRRNVRGIGGHGFLDADFGALCWPVLGLAWTEVHRLAKDCLHVCFAREGAVFKVFDVRRTCNGWSMQIHDVIKEVGAFCVPRGRQGQITVAFRRGQV